MTRAHARSLPLAEDVVLGSAAVALAGAAVALAGARAAAVALARENHIPIIVFSIHEKDGFAQILTGGGRKTIVHDK